MHLLLMDCIMNNTRDMNLMRNEGRVEGGGEKERERERERKKERGRFRKELGEKKKIRIY